MRITLLLFGTLLLLSCSDSTSSGRSAEGTGDAGPPTTVDPDSIPDNQTAVIGKIFNYITGDPIGDAFVSTFPPTSTIRTNGQGEFVLTEGLVPGQVFELKGEANGYERRFVPARPVPGGRVNINLPLIPTERAVPVRFEPPLLVFTSDVQEVRILATSLAEGNVTLAFELPPWLSLVGEQKRPLAGGARQTFTFRLSPDAFAEAAAALTPGAALSADVKVTDEFKRIGLLSAVAVPAPPGLVSLETASLERVVLTVGSTADVALTARYVEQPLIGAVVRAATEGEAAALDDSERVSDEEGVAIVRVRGAAVGESTFRASLPANLDVKAVLLTVEVRPAGAEGPVGACSVNNGGCDPLLYRCELTPEGGTQCADINECLENNGECGPLDRAICVNQLGAQRTCENVNECLVEVDGTPVAVIRPSSGASIWTGWGGAASPTTDAKRRPIAATSGTTAVSRWTACLARVSTWSPAPPTMPRKLTAAPCRAPDVKTARAKSRPAPISMPAPSGQTA